MTIWNLGSINLDFVYELAEFPKSGETVVARQKTEFLGGKGTNISVAAVRAAAHVIHIGSVGSDGHWAVERLMEYGVDTSQISVVDEMTGHAIIVVDQFGENQIIVFPGANRKIPTDGIKAALSSAQPGDFLVVQNETNAQIEAAILGHRLGITVCYVAAPFDDTALSSVLPFIDLLILNEVEALQLEKSKSCSLLDLSVNDVIVTRGKNGSRWFQLSSRSIQDFPTRQARAIDTTGAGDTFAGFLLAGLHQGLVMQQAISQANLAASIMVTRHGTADVIPDLKDVQDLMLSK
ncbi:MAG: ribokinase [Aestuariivita sp.]|nr:ribokinase [Aestuariivita sp.]